MYFGMSGFLITLSRLLVSAAFGTIMPACGYDTALDIQPASVDLGFRIFLTVPTSIGFFIGGLFVVVVSITRETLTGNQRNTY
jgi:Na+/melibiose symporter-like transporter